MNNDWDFITEVQVRVYPHDGESVFGVLAIEYNLTPEANASGIRSLTPVLNQIINCHVKNIPVYIDTSCLGIDWIEGRSLRPVDMDIYLKANGEVDYRSSVINFTYIDPTY